jgi:hypothetical protein
MVSGAVLYVPSYIKIGSSVQKLIGGGGFTQAHTHTHTHAQQRDLINLLHFLKIRNLG